MPKSPHLPKRPRWSSLLLLALGLTLLLIPLRYAAQHYYEAQLGEQNGQTLDLYVANLLGTLRRYEVLPDLLGDLPVLRHALEGQGDSRPRTPPARCWKTSASAPGRTSST